MLGTVFLLANLLAGISALTAGRLARRIGLLNTLVFTHLPSNVLLVLVPLMPDVYWAVGVLLRFGFLAKERSLLWALLRRRIRIKGSPRLLVAFGKCFPS